MRKALALGVLSALAFLSVTGRAGPVNVRGKIAGQEKLVPDVYAETQKPESKRWTWREPSPSVAPQFRVLSADPSRDVCIAATSSANQGAGEARRMAVTGGRVVPTTIVVSPGTQLVFKNFDPFKHRVYVVGQTSLAPEDMQPNAARTWSAPGAGRYEVRDELFPSVRTFVVVDPQAVTHIYPGRDGAFGLSLTPGDYVLKAFFNGKQVGKSVPITAKEKLLELKDPFNVSEGGDGK